MRRMISEAIDSDNLLLVQDKFSNKDRSQTSENTNEINNSHYWKKCTLKFVFLHV